MRHNNIIPSFVKPHAPAWVTRPAPALPVEKDALNEILAKLSDREHVTETLIVELPPGGHPALSGAVPYLRRVFRTGDSYEVFHGNKNGQELGCWNSNAWRETTRDASGNVLTYRDSKGVWYEYTRDANGRELTYWDNLGQWRESTYEGNARVAFRQGVSPAPALVQEVAGTGRTMADNFIAAWDRWDKVNWEQEPRYSAPIFTEWANEQGLIGDDAEEGQFLYLGCWGLQPDPDKSILAYDVMDFEDGSIAFRRSYESDHGKAWHVARPASPVENDRELAHLPEREKAARGVAIYHGFLLKMLVQRMLAEIEADMANGHVPRSVRSFSELHDYVDANCYGGFCDKGESASLAKVCGGEDGLIDLMNQCQNAVNASIAEGAFDRQKGPAQKG